MKRKPQVPKEPATESPVAPEILESAKRSLASDSNRAGGAAAPSRAKTTPRCVVCDGEATQTAGEQLCWVCRRLKISAWREVEQQASAQE